jgi:hypothetical protein
VGHSPLPVPPRFPSECRKDAIAIADLDSSLQSQFAMLRTELLQMVVERIEEVSRPLLEEVATIKLLLARVTGSLECTSDESAEHESSVVGEECIFGCFSPRGRPCPSSHRDMSVACESMDVDEITAPVMEIIPELHELCGSPLRLCRCCIFRWPPLGPRRWLPHHHRWSLATLATELCLGCRSYVQNHLWRRWWSWALWSPWLRS